MVNQKERLARAGLIMMILGCVASISAIYYIGPALNSYFWFSSVYFALSLLLWGCGFISRRFVYTAAIAIALLLLIQAINY